MCLFFIAGEQLEAKSFWYTKTEDGRVDEHSREAFDVLPDTESQSISIRSDRLLDLFPLREEIPLQEEIKISDSNDVDSVIEGALLIISGSLFITDLKAYKVSNEIAYHQIDGVFMFFFPVQERFLYMKCNKESYLIATSSKPTDERALERLKSPSEIREFCLEETAYAW